MILPSGDLADLAEAAASDPHPHPLPRALAFHGAMGGDPLDKVAVALGAPANAIWGTRETGALVAGNGVLTELRAGSPGRAAPGITVEAVDEAGRVMRAGERGMLAVAPGAPGGFLGYVGEVGLGRMRLPSGWLMTGCLGSRDLDGYLWPDPAAPSEDVVTVAGRPVALADIDGVLALHPKVRQAAVTWTGTQLKAFVVVAEAGGDEMETARELQAWCAARRAVHEVPTRIEFLKELPVDASGGVSRKALLDRFPQLGALMPEDRL